MHSGVWPQSMVDDHEGQAVITNLADRCYQKQDSLLLQVCDANFRVSYRQHLIATLSDWISVSAGLINPADLTVACLRETLDTGSTWRLTGWGVATLPKINIPQDNWHGWTSEHGSALIDNLPKPEKFAARASAFILVHIRAMPAKADLLNRAYVEDGLQSVKDFIQGEQPFHTVAISQAQAYLVADDSFSARLIIQAAFPLSDIHIGTLSEDQFRVLMTGNLTIVRDNIIRLGGSKKTMLRRCREIWHSVTKILWG